MYDSFSRDYDRFVNWENRLRHEMPFLLAELRGFSQQDSRRIRVLDAACGTGQHAIALAKEDYSVTGVDNSAGMIDIAQTNAENLPINIRFEEVGFGRFSEAFSREAFDAVICLGNSLPHVLDETTLLETLTDFRSVLRQGGKLIIQNQNFDKIMAERIRWMSPQTFRQGEEVWIFNRFYDFDPDSLITFNIQILTSHNGKDFEEQNINTRLLPIGQDLLTDYLRSTRFTHIRLYGDLQGSAFSLKDSGNLVVSAMAG